VKHKAHLKTLEIRGSMKRNTKDKPFWELGLNPITMKKEAPICRDKALQLKNKK